MIERALLAAAARLRRDGEPFMVATVVAVRGSTYRRPGARMLFTRDRRVAGAISGGTLEADLLRRGWWLTEDGPRVVRYDSTFDDDAPAIGCGGVVEVLVERDGAGGQVDRFDVGDACVIAQARGAIATVFRSSVAGVPVGARLAVVAGAVTADSLDPILRGRLVTDARAAIDAGESVVRAYALPGGEVEAVIEALVPPPRLFVFGGGDDAVPLVALASNLGWESVVCLPHETPEARARFVAADRLLFAPPEAWTAEIDASDSALVVVMGHHVGRDRAALAAALASQAGYVGVLGPRHRTDRILADLGLDGDDPRLHAPVGLALGAETPAEIALAIVAEAQAALTGATAVNLRRQHDPIHARPFPAAV